MYIVLSSYHVSGVYRSKAAARRLVREINACTNFTLLPEDAPRIVVGDEYDDFVDQCHDTELWSIWLWIDRSVPVWGRVSLG